jgi:polysaccharide biosynthesis/export protein
MRIATVILTLGCGLAVWQGCSASQGPPVNYAAEPDPRKHGFLLGPSDVLRISVWHNPDLSTDAIVRPDGNITLPLIGELVAAGSHHHRTPAHIRQGRRRGRHRRGHLGQ